MCAVIASILANDLGREELEVLGGKTTSWKGLPELLPLIPAGTAEAEGAGVPAGGRWPH